jgi:hypothetical protein
MAALPGVELDCKGPVDDRSNEQMPGHLKSSEVDRRSSFIFDTRLLFRPVAQTPSPESRERTSRHRRGKSRFSVPRRRPPRREHRGARRSAARGRERGTRDRHFDSNQSLLFPRSRMRGPASARSAAAHGTPWKDGEMACPSAGREQSGSIVLAVRPPSQDCAGGAPACECLRSRLRRSAIRRSLT